MAAPSTSEPRINERIRAREVRLVGADGEQVGIVPLPEALARAQQAGLDLVEVADKANPPVCKIMDHGKAVYEAKQRDKASRKKSTRVDVKEMKYRPKIGRGDFDTKTRKVKQFLGEGNRVKITIMFRGREMQHPELGRKILDQVAEQADEVSKIEVYPKLDGRNMVMVLVPDREKLAAKIKAEQEAAKAARAKASATATTEASVPASEDDQTPPDPTEPTEPTASIDVETETEVETDSDTQAPTGSTDSTDSPDSTDATQPVD